MYRMNGQAGKNSDPPFFVAAANRHSDWTEETKSCICKGTYIRSQALDWKLSHGKEPWSIQSDFS